MKKLLTGIFIAFYALIASATTLNPIQLLNPAGSSSGQAIVSTGTSTVPVWGGVGVNGIAAIAANTVLANATGSSASPTAFAMPSCTGATNALGYTSGTGIICNASINAATLGGATFASPSAAGYGSTTPEPVFATTLNASGNDALLYTNTSAQSIPNTTATTVTTWTKTFDRVNANLNASTGVFTAPVTGFYQVIGQITFSSAAGVVNSQFAASIVANGATVAIGSFWQESVSTVPVAVAFGAVVFLTSGQTIVIQATQGSGSARTLTASAGLTYLSINRIP
jgi:hypothetical protein